jgi:hypothetical protein
MLDERQRALATSKLQQLSSTLELHLDPGPRPDDLFSKTLCELVDQIVALAPEKTLKVVEAHSPGKDTPPSLTIGNIKYLAIPLERELEPFLDLLLTQSSPPPLTETERGLATMPPAEVKILIAPTCPNCPKVVAACAEVAARLRQVSISIIDVQVFAELAGSCRSVPTVVIDGTRTVVGPLTAAELTEILGKRDQEEYFKEALASMIEAGRIDELVPLLVSDQGMAVLPALLAEGTMQQRMGLMLAIQGALEQDPHSLNGAVSHLLPLLESKDATVRGDTADILGQIGAPGARDALTQLLSDENPDVREMAEEALSMLREPS